MSKRSYPRFRYTGELAKPIWLQDDQSADVAEVFKNKLKTLASVHKVNLEGPNAEWVLAIAVMQAPRSRLAGNKRARPQWTARNGLGEALCMDT